MQALEKIDPALAQGFLSLTPDEVLASVEQSGSYTTGVCYALNSLENRVYEVELEDGTRTPSLAAGALHVGVLLLAFSPATR